jgi:long-chain acyl-CoA synthetase
MAMLLEDLRAGRGDDPAVIDAEGCTTWAELDERVNRLVHHLRAAGVEPGDRVALLAGNRREIEEVLLACAHAGWLTVPINWHFAPDEVAYVLEDSAATALVVDGEHAQLAADAIALSPQAAERSRLVMSPEPPEGFGSYEAALAAAPADEPADQMLGGVMFYTSGTTGRPKGVRNTAFQLGASPEVLKLTAGAMTSVGIPPDGRTLLCGPHYHSAQWAFSFMPLLAGSTVVMQRRFVPEETLALIDEHRITNVHLVPTQFVRLLRVDDAVKAAFRGDSLRLVLHGAAPCAPAVKRAMIDWFGPIVTEYYGATEGGVVTLITAEEWLTHPGSVGRAMPIVEIKVVAEDDDGQARPAPPGVEGTIHVRSLLGTDFEYLNAPEKTAEAHREPGFFTLGDVGYLDDDGYLYLSDRKIDMIISGGVNIYPAEIEAVLVGHPAVLDVAVFGVPNEEFGEEVKAAVQLAPGVEWTDALAAELSAYAREHLAGYKVPKSYDVVDEMPRSEAGKLLKRQLRAPYWEGTGRKI